MKECSKCKKNKSLENFNFYHTRNYYYSVCKSCKREELKKLVNTVGTYAYVYKRYRKLKEGRRRKKEEFTLTVEELKEIICGEYCYYCHQNDFERFDGKIIRTIDRVDNTKGYSKDNCVLACWDCNSRKRTSSLEKLEDDIKKLDERKKVLIKICQKLRKRKYVEN